MTVIDEILNKHTDKTILGVDIGTSGIRASIVDISKKNQSSQSLPSSNTDENLLDKSNTATSYKIIHYKNIEMPTAEANANNEVLQSPSVWITALDSLLKQLSDEIDLSQITHFVADATSSTVLLTDQNDTPLTSAIMYNDNRSAGEAYLIKQLMEKAFLQHCIKNDQGANLSAVDDIEIMIDETTGTLGMGAMGASSSLAKALRLNTKMPFHNESYKIYNQLDFINQYLGDCNHCTDENNALKLGFDSIKFAWPSWVESLANNLNLKLPKVVKPGAQIGQVSQQSCNVYGFNKNLKIMAGTTDSIAAFLASGARAEGQAAVSLGSSIAIKLITNKPVFSPLHGLYSHRLGKNWLVGGASNAGGKIFTLDYKKSELSNLTEKLPEQTIKEYIAQYHDAFYPLTSPGERFPISDSKLEPVLPLKPISNDYQKHRDYTTKLSLGLTNIEYQSFQFLESLSDTKVKQVFTLGGGVKNQVWQQFRQQLLNCDLTFTEHQDASFGVTKLLWE